MLSHHRVLAHSSAPFVPPVVQFGHGSHRPTRPPRAPMAERGYGAHRRARSFGGAR